MNRYTCSLGGKETPGPLVLARIPSAIVPVCVVNGTSVSKCVVKRTHSVSVMVCVSKMACVSARMEMDFGRFQAGDGCGEPSAPCRVNLITTTACARSVAHFAHGLHVCVCAIRPGNVPRWTHASRVDG